MKITIREVAQSAGVSTATVSRVLNDSGYVSEDARKRVLETVDRMHYKPNTIARSLKQERTGGIGFILPDLTNPYFMAISRLLQQRLAAEGYYVFFMDSGEHAEKERQALQFLLEKRVEAILLAGTGANQDVLRRIAQGGPPIVLLDRRIDGLDADIVKDDNEAASSAAVRLLARRGHRNIGLLHGPLHVPTALERRDGAWRGLRQAGLPRRQANDYGGDYTKESGIRAARYFLTMPEPPTAVFSANNEMTFGLYLGLKAMGLPLDRIEVASFGELEFASLFRHRLFTIRQDPVAVAEAAAELLFRRLRHPRDGRREARIIAPQWQESPE